MKICASGDGTTVGLHGKPGHSGAVNEGGEKKAREMLFHRQDFELLQPLVKTNKVLAGDQVIGTPIALTILQRVRGTIQTWMASAHLDLAHHSTHVVLDLGCTRSIGLRKTIRRFQTCALYCGITTGFFPCSKCFVFASSEAETCRENCLVHFPTTPPCSTRVDVAVSSQKILHQT